MDSTKIAVSTILATGGLEAAQQLPIDSEIIKLTLQLIIGAIGLVKLLKEKKNQETKNVQQSNQKENGTK